MAGNKKIISLSEQSQQFAKTLYHSIWAKFSILKSDRDQCHIGAYPAGCRTDIHKAVICEQLLLRDFLTNHFFRSKSLVMQQNIDSVLAFCNVMCLSTVGKWDYFKRLLRCSALIAEFFLYRYPRASCPQLHKVLVIWCEVFNKLFSDEFWDNGGWQSLSDYANYYIPALYIPLNKAVLEMEEPYEEVRPHCLQNVPKLSFPVTDATRLCFEMRLALDCVDACRVPKTQISNNNLPGLSSPNRRAGPQKKTKSRKNEVFHYVEQLFLRGLDEERAAPAFQLITPIDDDVAENKPIPKILDLKDLVNPPMNPADPYKSAMIPDVKAAPSKDPRVFEDSPSQIADADLKDPVNPPTERVVDLENPAELYKVATIPDVKTPPSICPKNEAVFEDSPSQQLESPDSCSRKRCQVLETSEDIKPPPLKQLKLSE